MTVPHPTHNATDLAKQLEQSKERIAKTLRQYADAPDTACIPAGDCVLLGDLRALVNAAPSRFCLSANITGDLVDVAEGVERGPFMVTLTRDDFNPYRVRLTLVEVRP